MPPTHISRKVLAGSKYVLNLFALAVALSMSEQDKGLFDKLSTRLGVSSVDELREVATQNLTRLNPNWRRDDPPMESLRLLLHFSTPKAKPLDMYAADKALMAPYYARRARFPPDAGNLHWLGNPEVWDEHGSDDDDDSDFDYGDDDGDDDDDGMDMSYSENDGESMDQSE